MNLTSQDRQRLRQQMDACRFGSDDLSLAEMSELASALLADAALREEWESRQRSERQVASAMHELAVPAGLAERILAAAAANDGRQQLDAIDQAMVTVADSNADAEVQPAKRQPMLTRRHWSWIGGAALVLAAIALIGKYWPGAPQEVSQDQLALSAQQWFLAALQRTGDAHNLPARVPFPDSAVTRQPLAWRYLTTPEERSLVAFDLTNVGDGGSVFLFAAQTTKKYQVGSVPATVISASGGLEVGAWQQGDVIYVLVVDRSKGDLRLKHVLRNAKLA